MSIPVVALGGGHGLSATLSALRQVTERITAIVTVADDGGSSGRLREELGVLPPGDLRMALAALCSDDTWGRTWREVLQHRFTGGGSLDGHSVGNLLITALWDLHSTIEGLELVGQLLGAKGRVLPMASVPLEIEADVVENGASRVVRGQVAVATASGQVTRVRVVPPEPPVAAEVLAQVADAEWLVLGPGSWFTSVIPHLLVPELQAAIVKAPARRLLVLNLDSQPGETEGFTPEAHLEALTAHAPALQVDVVLADPRHVPSPAALAQAAAPLGAEVVLEQVARSDGSPRHDPALLAGAFTQIFRRGRIGAWQ